jgi:hypothetical protein
MQVTDPIIPGEAGATAESEAEKRRRLWRERKRRQRLEQREIKVAQTTEAEEEWWARNRALLPPTELEAMIAQDALCLDYVTVLDYATRNNISLDDLNYILDEKDCVADLVEFVKQNPCPRLGRIHKDPDIPTDWSTGVWRKGAKYWQDPALLERLYAEGPATERIVKYGLLSGVPDWRVSRFLLDAAKWPWMKVADLLGYETERSVVTYR